jgi:hypothetical protein
VLALGESGTGDRPADPALARASAEAEAAGAAAAAAAAERALGVAAAGDAGSPAAWVAEMLEAQRPRINAAHERGVPVRVRTRLASDRQPSC